MAFIKVNGQSLPPCKRGVSVVVTTVVNAGRNANGATVGQKVGRDQYKIDGLEWSWLTADEWGRILKLFKNFYVNVTFTDPVSDKPKTIKMYCGDRTASPYWVNDDGAPTHYTNCKVNLIDTGV